jgi:biotin carboxylase
MTKKKTSTVKARKDIVLFVASVPEDGAKAVHSLRKGKNKLKIAMIYDSRKPKQAKKLIKEYIDILIPVDFSSPSKLAKALLEYRTRLLAVTCRGEYNIALFQKVIPHVPYVRTPTVESLGWATNKLDMRKRFYAFDKAITPKFAIVDDAGKDSVKKIRKRVRFPMVVKPTGLAASLLVTLCYHQDELETALRSAFRKVRKIYREQGSAGEPQILVEEFMEGEMYSIDSYVTSIGKVYHCPIVHIKTGHAAGYDDFFGYIRTTPTRLSPRNVKMAQDATRKAIHSLGLRNVTVHTELIKTEVGWKIIEAGPRIGGNRVNMYRLSYGINHALNDVLIRIPKKPQIPTKLRGYTAVIDFYPRKEGIIKKIKGMKKAKLLASHDHSWIRKKVGERSKFSKHGGKSVVSVTLFNKDRSDLLADIRRLEKMVEIETGRK